MHRIAESVCRGLHAGHPFTAGTLSISVGGTCVLFKRGESSRALAQPDVEVAESLFRAVDVALYRAKTRGRNRVCVPCDALDDEDDRRLQYDGIRTSAL